MNYFKCSIMLQILNLMQLISYLINFNSPMSKRHIQVEKDVQDNFTAVEQTLPINVILFLFVNLS